MDFSSRDPISPYNILAKGPHVDAGFFSETRADLLMDLLPGGDGLSLGGTALLRRSLVLLSEHGLPVTSLNDLLTDESFRGRLLSKTADRETRAYFIRQFGSVPKQTIAALSRRVDALFSSEAVRLSLSGATAPDFRSLQDDNHIVLVNCFGQNLSRSVRRLLQALVLSDIAQAVFARRQCNRSFTWICDEAQNFFLTERLRDQMNDLLTMSRSFGSFLCCITQNISAAVNDTRLLHTLFTNVRWSLSMRGDPSDAAFLKSVLPVTGRKIQPRATPFEEARPYSLNDERTIELNAIAHLPDRVGYLWLRAKSSEAIKITTPTLLLPDDAAVSAFTRDPQVGMRISRSEYAEAVAERNKMWEPEPVPALASTLTERYRKSRGRG